eukprot:scaffold6257_cov144-Cylindrotheca_fusiformis.AAC.2
MGCCCFRDPKQGGLASDTTRSKMDLQSCKYTLFKHRIGAAAKMHGSKSIVDIAWDMLMSDEYAALRACIYEMEDELWRFRQLVANTVMATDIVDKELQALRKAHWETAFLNVDSAAKAKL